jgi:hypothetical protein
MTKLNSEQQRRRKALVFALLGISVTAVVDYFLISKFHADELVLGGAGLVVFIFVIALGMPLPTTERFTEIIMYVNRGAGISLLIMLPFSMVGALIGPMIGISFKVTGLIGLALGWVISAIIRTKIPRP